jgi:hypothetical protein
MLNLNGSPKTILLGTINHTFKIGSPHLELFVNDKPHNVIFGKARAFGVKLKSSENSAKSYRFKLEGPPPDVYIE